MYFKLTNRNPYRDLVRNARKICLENLSDEERMTEFRNLYKILKPRLKESEAYLNSSPAFSKRCEHWNQRSLEMIRPMNNVRNPWLQFKRVFEQAISHKQKTPVGDIVSRELMWFYANDHRNDWINDR